MVLGMSLATFTLLHVVISLIGIGSGVVVLWGLLASKPLNGITAIFLITTILTSVTGFMFPFEHVTPGIILGVISLVLLAFAVLGRYALHLNGSWRAIYVVTAGLSLYLNVFVLIVQLFAKVPALHALAPQGKEPPFAIAQLIVLVTFLALIFLATKKFHPERSRLA